MEVIETFFSIVVADMDRAVAFYRDALGATASHRSPVWSSLRVAGVRLGLFHHAAMQPSRIGLHFVVSNLEEAHACVERAGGVVVSRSVEVAPDVCVSDVTDTEGNTFALQQSR